MSLDKDFLVFLLTTTRDQQKCILSTVTAEQTKTLVEVAYNLARLSDLGGQQKFITHLGDQKHTIRYKKSLIRNYSKRLINVLSAHKGQLMEL